MNCEPAPGLATPRVPFPYVMVAGNIASGKSTAVKAVGDRLGLRQVLEHADANPFFSAYYGDPLRWTFHALVAFLQLALAAHNRPCRSWVEPCKIGEFRKERVCSTSHATTAVISLIQSSAPSVI